MGAGDWALEESQGMMEESLFQWWGWGVAYRSLSFVDTDTVMRYSTLAVTLSDKDGLHWTTPEFTKAPQMWSHTVSVSALS